MKAQNLNHTTSLEVIDANSSKDQAYENFPVASWLLSRDVRYHVNIFYNFARTIDNIADNNTLSPDEKRTILSGFREALLGNTKETKNYQEAHAMKKSLEQTGISPQHCLDLIKAFIQDTTKSRYQNPQQLLDYCQLSAAPVGRYLLDLHHEDIENYEFSDPLCNALQILNHLQDCKEDYQFLGRVYIPMDWISEFDISIESLSGTDSDLKFRHVLDRTLNLASELLTNANKLPHKLTNQRLARESAVIINIAKMLENKIRSHDPLAGRIQLTKWQYMSSFLIGSFKFLVR